MRSEEKRKNKERHSNFQLQIEAPSESTSSIDDLVDARESSDASTVEALSIACCYYCDDARDLNELDSFRLFARPCTNRSDSTLKQHSILALVREQQRKLYLY